MTAPVPRLARQTLSVCRNSSAATSHPSRIRLMSSEAKSTFTLYTAGTANGHKVSVALGKPMSLYQSVFVSLISSLHRGVEGCVP